MKFILLSSIILLALPAAVSAYSALPVPFTSQAPEGKWTEPWKNACEETAIAMIASYYDGGQSRRLTAAAARDAILRVYRIKTNTVGWSLDEGSDKIASIINNFYPWEARMVENPSIVDIRAEIDAGRPVIVPAYGKALKNPNFRSGGPVYHTVVVSGYDDDTEEFIVQEPGTRHGLDFRYSYDRLMYAMHDFVPGRKTANTRKVAIFTSPDIDLSANTDGDKDGLTKQEELAHKTILWLSDSDGDGYNDGVEVKNGFSPAGTKIKNLKSKI